MAFSRVRSFRSSGPYLLVAILASLVVGAWPAITQYGLGFLTSSVWDPVTNEYGGLVMIYGTLATSIIALLRLPAYFLSPSVIAIMNDLTLLRGRIHDGATLRGDPPHFQANPRSGCG